jgi:hypothetical protein
MATTIHGKDSLVLLGKYDITNYLRSYEPDDEYNDADISVMGRAYHESIPGQISGVCKLEGLAGFGVGESMDILTALRGTTAPLTVAAPATAVGDLAVMLNGYVGTTSNPADIDSAIGMELEVRGQDGLDYGKLLHLLAAEVGTNNGTAVNNLAASTNGWSANLHVTAISGAAPSVVVKIQDSADGSSWADLASASFTAATAATTQHLSGTGTVRQYVRAVWTFGGTTTSITFAVAFARR